MQVLWSSFINHAQHTFIQSIIPNTVLHCIANEWADKVATIKFINDTIWEHLIAFYNTKITKIYVDDDSATNQANLLEHVTQLESNMHHVVDNFTIMGNDISSLQAHNTVTLIPSTINITSSINSIPPSNGTIAAMQSQIAHL